MAHWCMPRTADGVLGILLQSANLTPPANWTSRTDASCEYHRRWNNCSDCCLRYGLYYIVESRHFLCYAGCWMVAKRSTADLQQSLLSPSKMQGSCLLLASSFTFATITCGISCADDLATGCRMLFAGTADNYCIAKVGST